MLPFMVLRWAAMTLVKGTKSNEKGLKEPHKLQGTPQGMF